ncbi:MAG: hypothetical protein M5U01_00070 [Ardenticatenaceae bacterium]|nr:hypothetical protein [Ardenticatenaceae bacterium]
MSEQNGRRSILQEKPFPEPPDPEVRPKATRRRFSAAEKVRLLEAADACRERGELGALLRREGIYGSLFAKWREQRAKGSLQALMPQQRGRKPQQDVCEAELAAVRRENERLQARLAQAETIIEVQKNSRSGWGCRWRRAKRTSSHDPSRRSTRSGSRGRRRV